MLVVNVNMRRLEKKVSPSVNPTGDIGCGYPTNVYDGNGLSLPKLRQKMAQYCV
jgi:hypothetical protein